MSKNNKVHPVDRDSLVSPRTEDAIKAFDDDMREEMNLKIEKSQKARREQLEKEDREDPRSESEKKESIKMSVEDSISYLSSEKANRINREYRRTLQDDAESVAVNLSDDEIQKEYDLSHSVRSKNNSLNISPREYNDSEYNDSEYREDRAENSDYGFHNDADLSEISEQSNLERVSPSSNPSPATALMRTISGFFASMTGSSKGGKYK